MRRAGGAPTPTPATSALDPRREAPPREARPKGKALCGALPFAHLADSDGGAERAGPCPEQRATARSQGAVGPGGPAVLGGVLRRVAAAAPRSPRARWAGAGRAGAYLAPHHRLALSRAHR